MKKSAYTRGKKNTLCEKIFFQIVGTYLDHKYVFEIVCFVKKS